MATELAEKKCTPCEGKTARLTGEALARFSRELGRGWRIVDEHHLEKDYSFDDFRGALDFTNWVGEIAEAEGHHPDILLSWGKVRLQVWTHSIDGLSENDFILAAKADAAREARGSKL